MEWIECPECGGDGRIEVDVPRPHAGGFNCGFIDTAWIECEMCQGSGEIEIEDDENEE